MKKLFVLIVLYALYQNWDVITNNTNKPTFAADNVVVMYSTDWCGYCKNARQFFNDNNIAFADYDIEKSYDANERYEALGGQAIPLLQVNGVIIRGFQPRKIVASLH
ncbi:glutaredoxin family protein [Shewanella electrodiphila]|uniref:Glutaredoxin family protein n=1 Tax=Shewanella electrodiphila TaxID=934143 RepID=A0ABT0KM79_9GAMM|nr:glutaredoxin domain-containing protein [Shewanella electrodiphila]MCL1044958.1 glutaredoxin family protein [Shewanella electrodiphila]